MDFDEIIKKNIEERAIVCVDEFDKLIKDVSELFNMEKHIFKLQSQ